MLEQIMKKHRAAIRKVHKEKPIYHLDDLLKIPDQNAQTIDQLTEDILLGCTIVTIIGFSELRLEEVMRATTKKDIDNSWLISTSIFKKPISKVTLTFRQTSTPSNSPVFWLDNWTKKNSNRLKPTMLWYLTKLIELPPRNPPPLPKPQTREQHLIKSTGSQDVRTVPTQFSSSMIRISMMTQERDLGNFERQSQQKMSSRYVDAKIITRYDVVIYAFHQPRANL
ncbi:MAG: hypothetical protein EZS28_012696 [Streblomastix strix]|uniref:Uncharacterized protein n=1 Tax=Streblomastix strix TaxID=222440 RepID=A0A5J4WBN8_9EUKA|nr:MAG: hypothetical protein EZS28_012696 [Streblomastix strix]